MPCENEFIPDPYNEFAPNPEDRCAVLLVLDVSISMWGESIRQLNQGIQEFALQIKQDALTRLRVDIGIMTFGSKVDHLLLTAGKNPDGTIATARFVNADAFTPPSLSVHGDTPLYEALIAAVDALERRKQQYRAANIGYYRPFILLITDGAPTDSDRRDRAVAAIHDGIQKKKFSVLAVGVEQADMRILQELTAGGLPAQRLKGLAFVELFRWLSSSLKSISSDKPNTRKQLPPTMWIDT